MKTIALILLLMLPPAARAATADTVVWRDPMQPPAYALRQYRLEKWRSRQQQSPAQQTATKPAAKPWSLSSILYAPGRRRAIINGRLLAVGDRIDGARVTRIDRKRVQLQRQGRRITLRLETATLDLKPSRTR